VDASTYEDITYEVADGTTAVITINRPHRYNAFRGKTVDELIHAFKLAWANQDVRAVILTGAGDKAFCTGGDVKQRAETGDYGPTESGIFEIESFHRVIRRDPQAGHRRGERTRHRRRARDPRHLRHVDRRRERPFRAGGPARRIVRRRVRHGLPCSVGG
jgi:enoyl-CoA hydratase/carnithine racemase